MCRISFGRLQTSGALSSQAVSSQVLSTCGCLTSVFGMGTGGATRPSPLDIKDSPFWRLAQPLPRSPPRRTTMYASVGSLVAPVPSAKTASSFSCLLSARLALRQLRTVRAAPSKLYRKKTFGQPDTICSSQALGVLVLARSTGRPASTPSLSSSWSSSRLTGSLHGEPHLRAGFALRCFQRLSLPDAAARPHGWRHDRFTVGPSTPVLSYWEQPPSGSLRPRWIWTELSHDVLNPAHVPL